MRTANRLVALIRKAAEQLADFPERGWKVEIETTVPLREIVVKGFRIIYHATQTKIQVLRVVHGSRDLDSIFPKDE